jgi:hypothetical protein
VIWTEYPRLRVKVEKGSFSATFQDAEFGNRSKLAGEFKRKGKRIDGSFKYSNHFLADGEFPEEDCDTKKLPFSAERGGPDVIVPPPERSLRRG